jgi:hypothetical protein
MVVFGRVGRRFALVAFATPYRKCSCTERADVRCTDRGEGSLYPTMEMGCGC